MTSTFEDTHEMQNPTQTSVHWLLWDGACGFCRECVRWVERRDRDSQIRAVPYQDAPSPPMDEQLRANCREAVQIVMNDGTIYSAGMACAIVLEQIGYRKLGRFMQWRAVRPFVEWGYRRVANNRDVVGRIIFGRRCASQK